MSENQTTASIVKMEADPQDECGARLYASCDPRNGLRISVVEAGDDHWRGYGLTPQQARDLAAALIQWADEEDKPL